MAADGQYPFARKALVSQPDGPAQDQATAAARVTDVLKGLGRITDVAEAYGAALWGAHRTRTDWEADLAMIHVHGDLKSVFLSLLDASGAIILVYRLAFKASGKCVIDAATGVELPLLAPGAVTGHELGIQSRKAHLESYQHLLKIKWAAFEPREDRTTDRFKSEHTQRASGGRQQAHMKVCGARQGLTVVRVSNNGQFAFAQCLGLPGDIYLHARHAAPGLRFRPLQRVTAVLVQTPRGVQGRNIAQA